MNTVCSVAALGLRSLALIAVLVFGSISIASAACDGDACYKGILRDCVRLPSGDSVWVNHNPYTRCQVPVKKMPHSVRPLSPYPPAPPKHKTAEPPSPHITGAERAAHKRQCLNQKRDWITKYDALVYACNHCPRGDLACTNRECDALVRHADTKDAILARCPMLPKSW